MIRRIGLPLACLAALSGCATFTQDDVVASFNAVELDQDEFAERYEAVAGEPTDGGFAGDQARTVVTNWIVEQVLADAGLIERYESGPEASGILCVNLVRPSDINVAESIVERLEQGEEWTDMVATDFPEVPDAGAVSCIPTESLGPLAPQIAGIVQAVDPESLEGLGEVFETAEVTVDPQFGRFDPAAGMVVPLG